MRTSLEPPVETSQDYENLRQEDLRREFQGNGREEDKNLLPVDENRLLPKKSTTFIKKEPEKKEKYEIVSKLRKAAAGGAGAMILISQIQEALYLWFMIQTVRETGGYISREIFHNLYGKYINDTFLDIFSYTVSGTDFVVNMLMVNFLTQSLEAAKIEYKKVKHKSDVEKNEFLKIKSDPKNSIKKGYGEIALDVFVIFEFYIMAFAGAGADTLPVWKKYGLHWSLFERIIMQLSIILPGMSYYTAFSLQDIFDTVKALLALKKPGSLLHTLWKHDKGITFNVLLLSAIYSIFRGFVFGYALQDYFELENDVHVLGKSPWFFGFTSGVVIALATRGLYFIKDELKALQVSEDEYDLALKQLLLNVYKDNASNAKKIYDFVTPTIFPTLVNGFFAWSLFEFGKNNSYLSFLSAVPLTLLWAFQVRKAQQTAKLLSARKLYDEINPDIKWKTLDQINESDYHILNILFCMGMVGVSCLGRGLMVPGAFDQIWSEKDKNGEPYENSFNLDATLATIGIGLIGAAQEYFYKLPKMLKQMSQWGNFIGSYCTNGYSNIDTEVVSYEDIVNYDEKYPDDAFFSNVESQKQYGTTNEKEDIEEKSAWSRSSLSYLNPFNWCTR